MDTTSSAGGLAFLWTDEVNDKWCWKTSRVLCCDFLGENWEIVWRLFGVYGTSNTGENEAFWNMLQHEVDDCISLGDLNEVTDESEKQ